MDTNFVGGSLRTGFGSFDFTAITGNFVTRLPAVASAKAGHSSLLTRVRAGVAESDALESSGEAVRWELQQVWA
jgi:hypothetical protein